VSQHVDADPLAEPGRSGRRTAGCVQHCGLNRLVRGPARKQIQGRAGQPPIHAQDAEQRLGEHGVALLVPLAMLDPHHHAAAVDVADLQRSDFGHPQTRGIGRGQRHARLQARYRFQKPYDLVGAQHRRQLARLAGVGDPLGDRRLAERHPVKEAQRAHDKIERSPRNPFRREVDLIGAHILQSEAIGRAAEILAEPRHRMEVGSLRRRRQIADRHVLDHPPAQRAYLGHLKSPV
jgi:hypothetical protein